jgi:hypothetical protein
MLGAIQYKRRQPEKSLLYQVVQDNIGPFIRARAREGKDLPRYVIKEFEEYLRCGRLEHGLVRVWCEGCKHEMAVALSCKKRGFCPSCCGKRMVETAAHLVDNVLPMAPYRQWILTLPVPLRFWCATNRKFGAKVHRIIIRNIEHHYTKAAKRSGAENPEPGSITFVQHFGSALQFNLHYHILFLDGVFIESGTKFLAAEKLQDQQVEAVLARIAKHVINLCRKRGFVSEDPDQVQVGQMDSLFDESLVLSAALAASIKGKIAFGPRAGKNVRFIGEGFGFQEEAPLAKGNLCYSQNGFSIHAATRVHDYDRPQLEKLIKYISRPPVATGRLSKAPGGLLQYKLKTPFRDGKTHVLLSPEELLEKLTAIIPRPRSHNTKYSGVFAPHHPFREAVTLRPEMKKGFESSKGNDQDGKRKRKNYSWSQLLARSFKVDLTKCPHCGGELRVLKPIMARHEIDRYLKHQGLLEHPPPAPSSPTDNISYERVLD